VGAGSANSFVVRSRCTFIIEEYINVVYDVNEVTVIG
jgi:hypothetical protein